MMVHGVEGLMCIRVVSYVCCHFLLCCRFGLVFLILVAGVSEVCGRCLASF